MIPLSDASSSLQKLSMHIDDTLDLKHLSTGLIVKAYKLKSDIIEMENFYTVMEVDTKAVHFINRSNNRSIMNDYEVLKQPVEFTLASQL